MTKKMCVIDIEANGFNPTEIFCMWLKEIDDGMTSLGTMRLFTSKPNFNLFDEYSTVIAHNGCGYDFPVLKKLWGMDLPLSKQVDTLIMSRLSRPDRKGGHSLAAWGDRLKFKKTEYSNGWDELTDEMLEYCKNDVLVCEKVYPAPVKWYINVVHPGLIKILCLQFICSILSIKLLFAALK